MNYSDIVLIIVSILIALSTVIILIFAWRKRKRPHLGEPYVEALKLLIEGDKDTAFRMLQSAVRKGNAPSDAYIKLGALLREKGECTKALQIHQSLTVKTALTYEERIKLALNIAEDYEKLGKNEKAVKMLESTSAKMEVRDPKFFLIAGRIYNRLGIYDKAYDNLRTLKKLGSVTDRRIALFLSSSAEKEITGGNRKEARKLLQKALKHEPQCAYALFLLAGLESRDGNVDDAIEKWQQVALISADLAGKAVNKLEKTLFERGKFGQIERIYKEILEKRAGDENITLALANFYRKQGKTDEAITLLKDYISWHSESAHSIIQLTLNYVRMKDLDSIEELLEDFITKMPGTHRFSCTLCSFQSDIMRWHCPICNAFDSFCASHES